MQSVEDKILRRIRGKPKGWVWMDRKLEAYATWGMLPACLPSHRQDKKKVPPTVDLFSDDGSSSTCEPLR